MEARRACGSLGLEPAYGPGWIVVGQCRLASRRRAWRLVRTGGGALRAAAGRTDPVACRSSLWRGLLAGLSGTAGMAAATVGVRLLTGNGHERRAASPTVLMRRRGRRAKPVGAADAVAARRAGEAPEDA